MPYPFPGYLDRTADLAGNLISGFHAGAAVAGEQAQLQAQADRTSLELAMRERENERQQARQQQLLEMTRAYHEQQINLRKTALDEAQQKINLSTQIAARRYQAQRAIAAEAQAAGGTEDAFRSAYLGHPEAFSSAAGLSGFAKPSRAAMAPAWVPESAQTGPAHWVTSAGVPHVPPMSHQDLTASGLGAMGRDMMRLDPLMRSPGAATNFPGAYQSYQRMRRALAAPTGAGGEATVPEGAAPTGTDKLSRARELRRLHPDWTKQEIIEAVNAGQ